MTNMQRLVLVLAFIFAVLLGILLATTLFGGKGASPSDSATPSPAASTAASAAPSTGAPSPSAVASPSPSVGPSPSTAAVPPATISFKQLKLDATTDAAGTTRTITFVTGPGSITVKLATSSGGNSKACLAEGGKQLGCRTAVSGTLSAKTTKKAATFVVTLRGAAAATPVVDVTITFPAAKPKVTMTNARFDGTAAPAYNGLQVVATPRAKGTFSVSASWGGHPFLYEVDLIEQGGPGLKQVVATTGATKVSQGFSVAKPNAWMLVLKNTETGFGATPMTATYTWP